MSRQYQAALALILVPIAFFLLWDLPGLEGFVASCAVLLVSIFFYRRSARPHAP